MTHQLHFHCIPVTIISDDCGTACGEHTVDQLLSIMWQRGTLGTYVWKHVICNGQCYHRNGEYVQEGTCIPRADKFVRYREFREVELPSLRQNTSSWQRWTAAPLTANGSTGWLCPAVSNSCKVYRLRSGRALSVHTAVSDYNSGVHGWRQAL
jgi:hypothetical protein